MPQDVRSPPTFTSPGPETSREVSSVTPTSTTSSPDKTKSWKTIFSFRKKKRPGDTSGVQFPRPPLSQDEMDEAEFDFRVAIGVMANARTTDTFAERNGAASSTATDGSSVDNRTTRKLSPQPRIDQNGRPMGFHNNTIEGGNLRGPDDYNTLTSVARSVGHNRFYHDAAYGTPYVYSAPTLRSSTTTHPGAHQARTRFHTDVVRGPVKSPSRGHPVPPAAYAMSTAALSSSHRTSSGGLETTASKLMSWVQNSEIILSETHGDIEGPIRRGGRVSGDDGKNDGRPATRYGVSSYGTPYRRRPRRRPETPPSLSPSPSPTPLTHTSPERFSPEAFASVGAVPSAHEGSGMYWRRYREEARNNVGKAPSLDQSLLNSAPPAVRNVKRAIRQSLRRALQTSLEVPDPETLEHRVVQRVVKAKLAQAQLTRAYGEPIAHPMSSDDDDEEYNDRDHLRALAASSSSSRTATHKSRSGYRYTGTAAEQALLYRQAVMGAAHTPSATTVSPSPPPRRYQSVSPQRSLSTRPPTKDEVYPHARPVVSPPSPPQRRDQSTTANNVHDTLGSFGSPLTAQETPAMSVTANNLENSPSKVRSPYHNRPRVGRAPFVAANPDPEVSDRTEDADSDSDVTGETGRDRARRRRQAAKEQRRANSRYGTSEHDDHNIKAELAKAIAIRNLGILGRAMHGSVDEYSERATSPPVMTPPPSSGNTSGHLPAQPRGTPTQPIPAPDMSLPEGGDIVVGSQRGSTVPGMAAFDHSKQTTTPAKARSPINAKSPIPKLYSPSDLALAIEASKDVALSDSPLTSVALGMSVQLQRAALGSPHTTTRDEWRRRRHAEEARLEQNLSRATAQAAADAAAEAAVEEAASRAARDKEFAPHYDEGEDGDQVDDALFASAMEKLRSPPPEREAVKSAEWAPTAFAALSDANIDGQGPPDISASDFDREVQKNIAKERREQRLWEKMRMAEERSRSRSRHGSRHGSRSPPRGDSNNVAVDDGNVRAAVAEKGIKAVTRGEVSNTTREGRQSRSRTLGPEPTAQRMLPHAIMTGPNGVVLESDLDSETGWSMHEGDRIVVVGGRGRVQVSETVASHYKSPPKQSGEQQRIDDDNDEFAQLRASLRNQRASVLQSGREALRHDVRGMIEREALQSGVNVEKTSRQTTNNSVGPRDDKKGDTIGLHLALASSVGPSSDFLVKSLDRVNDGVKLTPQVSMSTPTFRREAPRLAATKSEEDVLAAAAATAAAAAAAAASSVNSALHDRVKWMRQQRAADRFLSSAPPLGHGRNLSSTPKERDIAVSGATHATDSQRMSDSGSVRGSGSHRPGEVSVHVAGSVHDSASVGSMGETRERRLSLGLRDPPSRSRATSVGDDEVIGMVVAQVAPPMPMLMKPTPTQQQPDTKNNTQPPMPPPPPPRAPVSATTVAPQASAAAPPPPPPPPLKGTPTLSTPAPPAPPALSPSPAQMAKKQVSASSIASTPQPQAPAPAPAPPPSPPPVATPPQPPVPPPVPSAIAAVDSIGSNGGDDLL